MSWDRPADLDVGEYEYQVRLNGVEVNTWQLTPHPQAVIPVTSHATISVVLRAIDKAKNQSKAVTKTGKIANSGLLDLESEMLGKKKDPRFHQCKGGKGKKCGHYNGGKAAGYARTYAKDYNDDYMHFRFDCTNFISQALHAGGMKFVGDPNTPDGVAWYGSKDTATKAFRGTDWFNGHFVTNNHSDLNEYKTRGSFARARLLHSGEKVQIGDVIQIEDLRTRKKGNARRYYFHAIIVSNFIGDENTDPDDRRRVSYHTEDEKDLEWGVFKERLNDTERGNPGKGNWTHIVIRPVYTGVNIR